MDIFSRALITSIPTGKCIISIFDKNVINT